MDLFSRLTAIQWNHGYTAEWSLQRPVSAMAIVIPTGFARLAGARRACCHPTRTAGVNKSASWNRKNLAVAIDNEIQSNKKLDTR